MPDTETLSPEAPVTFKASQLVETPPEPSPHVKTTGEKTGADQGAAPAAAPAAAPVPAPGPNVASVPAPVLPPRVDRKGNVFDPERHLPKTHPISGVWMPKKPRRGASVSSVGPARAPKSTTRSVVADDGEGGAAEPDDGAEPVDGDMPADAFQAAALGAVTTLYAAGMTLGGDEWQPSKDEHANLMLTTEAYFRAKGIMDISPGWALAIAVIAYAGPRFRQPRTLSTLQKIGAFFKRVAVWWKARSLSNRIPSQ